MSIEKVKELMFANLKIYKSRPERQNSKIKK